MSLSDNHITAGLPAWATNEEAADAVAFMKEAGLLPTEEATDDVERTAGADRDARRQSIKAICRVHWYSAYLALKSGDIRTAEKCMELAKEADFLLSPDAVLLGAIFGKKPIDYALAGVGMLIDQSSADRAKAEVIASVAPSNQYRHGDHGSRVVVKSSASPKSALRKPTTPSRKLVADFVRNSGLDDLETLQKQIDSAGFLNGIPARRVIKAMVRDYQLRLIRDNKILAI